MSEKKIGDYELVNHGIDTASYWQGAGTAYTKWDTCFTGIGDTPAEAADDAIEQAAMSGWETAHVVVDESEFPDEVADETAMHFEDCPHGSTSDDNHDDDCVYLVTRSFDDCTCDCDCEGEAPQYYVVLYVQELIQVDMPDDRDDPAYQAMIKRSAMQDYDPNADPITF